MTLRDGERRTLWLAFLTLLTMMAFAGNSIFTRLALGAEEIGAGDFALIRLGVGAVVLLALCMVTRENPAKISRLSGAMALALLVYVIGFSFAYLQLDAGLGALILFGGVQLTMMAGSAWMGAKIGATQILGGAIAFLGLLILFMPSELHLPMGASLMMVAAAIGWGIYSLYGRKVERPLPTTATNFVLAFMVMLALIVVLPSDAPRTARGVVLAVISGGVTSGMGYALWYAILPKLGAALAATIQLSVPIIAIAMGALFLQESVTTQMVVSACLVILGIGLSIYASQKPS